VRRENLNDERLKEVSKMNIGYYPGCALHGSSDDYETSVRACMKALGVQLDELQDWICCGATAAHSINKKLATALPARNLGIAQKMNLDRRYLSRIFKEKTGVTIKDYLIGVRMEEAKRRLETGESITDAARLCGYDDVCNFSKMFKKRFGISPQQWQQKNRM
jgi:AraC-like DNA-binding protein